MTPTHWTAQHWTALERYDHTLQALTEAWQGLLELNSFDHERILKEIRMVSQVMAVRAVKHEEKHLHEC